MNKLPKFAGSYCLTSYKKAWICWDLDNGHPKSKGYLWVFSTRKDALGHRKEQHKIGGARLSFPQKIFGE
jgi:hypothetical protein